jgi:membrane-bound lytic murein transglycosylase D
MKALPATRSRRLPAWFWLCCWLCCWPAGALVQAAELARPASLQPAIEFWTRVYTRINTNQGYIHDDRRLDKVYETLSLAPGAAPRGEDQAIAAGLARYRAALKRLAAGRHRPGDATEARILALWGRNAGAGTLRAAAGRLRFQRGQANRFRTGLERAGAWEAHIRTTLRGLGLPMALVALPHVESSYNATARSHAGAAGLWQLTEGTGKRFLRIDEVLDERLEPYRATEAAARFLQQNYAVLKSWPLAINAYNHGLAGMRRAVQATGSRDIGEIVARYDGPRFGFASRNFYAAFLAALDVSGRPERYFRDLQRHPPEERRLVELPAYLPAAAVAAAVGTTPEALRAVNPVLGDAVWRGHKLIPRGYRLRLPRDLPVAPARERVARLAARQGRAQQRPDEFYQVRRGDTLSAIAVRYQTDSDLLMRMNGLASPRQLRAGTTLRLPPPPGSLPPPAVVAARPPEPEPARREPDPGDARPVETPESLGADPADYEVAKDRTIEVQPQETLGHYAEWLDLSSERIRRLNRLREGQTIALGKRVRLDFARVSPRQFERRRKAYHRGLQEAYFQDHRIVGTRSHVLRQGESLWQLATQVHGVPLWLLRQYNPDLDVNAVLALGTEVAIPEVQAISRSE